jgi:oligosaccharide repeat unit polymerase
MVGPDHVVYQLNDHNTFYTLLASGFKSFGAFGIPILGFFLGVAVSNLKRRAIKGSLISSGYLILMISILFMGIFSSGLETLGLWLSLMSINVLFLSVNYLEKFR